MNEPPASRYLPPQRSGQPSEWITRSRGFSTSQTSLTPSSHCCGSPEPRSKCLIAAPARWPWVPSHSTVALATTSEPGSKLPSSWPSRPRPLSPVRTPMTRSLSSTSSLSPLVSGRMERPASSAFSPRKRPSWAIEVTWLPWLRNGGGVGLSGIAMRLVRKRTSSFSTVPYVGHSDSSMSGNSRSIADGCIIAPDSRCDPVFLPFSIRATGTSPSDSARAESSSSSCISRMAQARPAGPPPTMATPTSMRSSSASSGGPTTSFSGWTGGGKSIGATDIFGSAALLGLHCLSQLGQDLVQVADDAQVGELEDRRVLVLVDRDDVLRRLHADLVLDGARDAGRQVQLRRDALAGLADLRRVRVPARVDDRAGRRDGAAQGVGQLLAELEALGLAQAASARYENLGVLDVHVGAALLAALLHRGLGRPVGEVDVDVLDLRVAAAGLGDLERVQAADDHAGAALVGNVDDGRVLEDRPLGDELAVLRLA